MSQQQLPFCQPITINKPTGKVVINDMRGRPSLPPEESKDKILKARFTPTEAEQIKAFCHGRRITTTEYLRSVCFINPAYYDHIRTLSSPEVQRIVIPLLELLSKKF